MNLQVAPEQTWFHGILQAALERRYRAWLAAPWWGTFGYISPGWETIQAVLHANSEELNRIGVWLNARERVQFLMLLAKEKSA